MKAIINNNPALLRDYCKCFHNGINLIVICFQIEVKI